MAKKLVFRPTAFLTFDEFFESFPSQFFKKRSTILNAETIPQDIFYIKRGFARAYSVSSSGQELTITLFQPGDFFPLISTIEAKKIDYYVESLTEVEVVDVPRIDFIEFLRDRPDLTQELAMRLTERFESALKRMEILVFGTAAQKVIAAILILAARYGEKVDGRVAIKIPLTHRDLASLVGITRETTTLILRDLVKKNLLEFRRRNLCIKNYPALITEENNQAS